MYVRIFYGTMRPDKLEEARKSFKEAYMAIRKRSGFLSGQHLESGYDFVAITSWETQEDLNDYANSELASRIFSKLLPCLMGSPTIKSYRLQETYLPEAEEAAKAKAPARARRSK